MAGYKPQRKIYKLDFDGTDLDGLVVEVSSVPIGTLLKLQEAYESMHGKTAETAGSAILGQLFGIFASALVSWNLLDENDREVPATLEGVMSQDATMVLEIVRAWGAALNGVPAPLDGGSASGATLPEASLGLESASQSLVN